MSVKWDGTKLLEIIAGNEKKVAELYKVIAQTTGVGGEFFLKMAYDEEKHEIMYRGMLTKYAGKTELELEEDDASYMDLLITNDMLINFDEIIAKARNVNFKSQIFDISEKVERDSVIYVSEFMRLYPEIAPSEMKIVLQEEKKHLQMILQKKADRAMFGIGM
jgi:rubrerythrin